MLSIQEKKMDFDEVARLAQLAHTKAMEADMKAESARMSLSAHEKLTAERYENLNLRITDMNTQISNAGAKHEATIEKIYLALDKLKEAVSKAAGADVAIKYVFAMIGAAGALYGFLK